MKSRDRRPIRGRQEASCRARRIWIHLQPYQPLLGTETGPSAHRARAPSCCTNEEHVQRICQDFLSIQQPQVVARDGGGYRKEVGRGASKTLELNCRGLPASSAHPVQVGGCSFPSTACPGTPGLRMRQMAEKENPQR